MYNKFNGEEIEGIIGYTFKNKALLKQAFTHASAGGESYDRLEFLGDAFLNFVVARNLVRGFKLTASEMSVLRSRMVSLNPLSNTIERLGLHKHIICCDYYDVVEAKGRRENKTKSDIFEALLGAILEDGGEKCALDFLHKFLRNAETETAKKDARTQVKEQYIDKLKCKVDFNFTEIVNGFSVDIIIDGEHRATGKGRSKDLAKEDACLALLLNHKP